MFVTSWIKSPIVDGLPSRRRKSLAAWFGW
jgi:hypothetical protein